MVRSDIYFTALMLKAAMPKDEAGLEARQWYNTVTIFADMLADAHDWTQIERAKFIRNCSGG